MNLESPKVSAPKSSKEIFDFLSDINNFEALMPENTSKFEVLSEDTFVFALKGMPEIVLKKKDATAHSRIEFGAAGGKIDFSLVANISDENDSESGVQLVFSGDFNPMMSMMIKGPINKFIETLATNLPKTV
ncbi:SRPBCC family protein [Hyunsoonleella sp. SJ7]|uniref:SRPBCC family protein n=1 Tax=Hyunsoonleella aquatilis TaxID=2762758 RepID=A0A923H7S4_9FLAO|nr:SRPBCC family protein [Hyunsoonleella aquatilis]MBC3757368.1 SRPBCC family protein [Hyunsoonleella aquatilis]